jgi:phage terminase large subunit
VRYYSRIFTWRDTPELVDPETVEDARETTPAATFAREWECDFDSAEGLVYSGFDETFHVREVPERIHFYKRGLGIDHGWSDPGVFLEYGISGHGADSALWITGEHYHTEKPNHEWDQLASSKYHGWQAWADPSRPDRINDLRRAGLAIRGADNSIDAGVARVADLLHIRSDEAGERWARLYVSPRCVNIIDEFAKYKRKPDPMVPGRFLDDIIDKDNHAMDALRYLAVGEFGRPENRKFEVRGS